MTYALSQTEKRTCRSSVFEWALDRLADLSARWQQRRAARRAYAVLQRLSEAQCRDAGIDRFAIDAPKPVIEIEAGLMARLMQMR